MGDYLLAILGSDVDKFYTPEVYPNEGDFAYVSFTGQFVGGAPLNVGCVTATKECKVKALDYLSDDPSSTTTFLLEEMKKRNVDVSHIQLGKATNGEVAIYNTGAKRTMFIVIPQRPKFETNEKLQSLLNEAKYIYSMPHIINESFGSVELLKKARENGVNILFDGAGKYTDPSQTEMILNYCDGLFINTTDYKNLEEAIKADPKEVLFKNGCKFIALTDGENGAKVFTKEKDFFAKAAKISEVVDSTGAGDSFAGQFIAGLLKGYSYQKCLNLACLAGGYCCLKMGALASAVSEQQIIDFGKEIGYDF